MMREWRHQKRVREISIYGMPPPANGNIYRKKSAVKFLQHRTLSISLFPVLTRRIELDTYQTRAFPLDVNRPAPSFLGEITLAVLYLHARVDYVRVPLLPPRGKKIAEVSEHMPR